jgi:hypothetical protein
MRSKLMTRALNLSWSDLKGGASRWQEMHVAREKGNGLILQIATAGFASLREPDPAV